MIDTKDIARQLRANAETIRTLVRAVSEEQVKWQPSAESWSITKVMEHLYNEERTDFRQHLKEMLSDPPQPWGALRQEHLAVESCRQALDGFLVEREASLAWLEALESPDWSVESQVVFDWLNETVTLSAGDVLASWVDHDLAHLSQIIGKLHAWHETEMAPYSTGYAGGKW